MKYLLIGGSGAIGTELARTLSQCGYQVSVCDIHIPQPIDRISGVDYFLSRNCIDKILHQLLIESNFIVYLASTTVPATSNQNIVFDIESNLISLVNILDFVAAHTDSVFIYFSSGGTVYGNHGTRLVNEDSKLQPNCSYGIIKTTAEYYINFYAETRGLKYYILRVSNPYGMINKNKIGVQGIIPTIFTSALTQTPINIWGDGSIVRDYLYVEDLIDAVVKTSNSTEYGLYNIGAGVGFSLTELLNLCSYACGRELKINYLPPRQTDLPYSVLDIKRANSKLNWYPLCNLENGLSKYWKEFIE